MRSLTCNILAAALLTAAAAPVSAQDTATSSSAKCELDSTKGTVAISLNGKPFTELRYTGFAKPILYPILTAGGLNLVRRWPVEAAGPDEEEDHPHHKGLWFTHGAVNGVDFWKEGPDAGRIVVQGTPATSSKDGTVTVVTSENWLAPGDKKICSSSTTITCGTERTDRWLDYAITITASQGDLTLGDTKEGTMGIRSHPALNLKGKVAKGSAINSEGEANAALWGRPAKWVDYTAPVGGETIGIACFDHPSNLRHPTTWHARDYGLIAANPFGLHDFDKKKNAKGSGDHIIKSGESLTLRYRWLFHTGDTKTADIAARWTAWSTK